MSLWELIILYKIQSSTNSLSDDVTFLEMLLMYSRNRRRLSTVSCGTSDVTVIEDLSLRRTHCVQLINQALTHLKILCPIPQYCKFSVGVVLYQKLLKNVVA